MGGPVMRRVPYEQVHHAANDQPQLLRKGPVPDGCAGEEVFGQHPEHHTTDKVKTYRAPHPPPVQHRGPPSALDLLHRHTAQQTRSTHTRPAPSQDRHTCESEYQIGDRQHMFGCWKCPHHRDIHHGHQYNLEHVGARTPGVRVLVGWYVLRVGVLGHWTSVNQTASHCRSMPRIATLGHTRPGRPGSVQPCASAGQTPEAARAHTSRSVPNSTRLPLRRSAARRCNNAKNGPYLWVQTGVGIDSGQGSGGLCAHRHGGPA